MIRDHRLRFRLDFIQASQITKYMKRLHHDALAIAESLESNGEILLESVQRFGHTDRGESRFGG